MFGLPNVPVIDAQKVYDALKNKSDVRIVDVRTEREYSGGSIIGSINIPLQELSSRIEKALPDKDKTVYVYCLSGSRSITAVSIMQKMGYKNSFSMTSGILAWRSKQYPLSSD